MQSETMRRSGAIDPRTPVVVGVGQFTERIDDAGYRGMSSVDRATRAVRAALADTGADVSTVAGAIEVFAGLRQFEICTPFTKPPLGCSDNYVRSVANRVGADPARGDLLRRASLLLGARCRNLGRRLG